MTAFALATAGFLVWSIIGLGVLAALRAPLAKLRVVLAAPAVGTAVVVLPLFLASQLGAATGDVAVPIFAVLLVASTAVLVRRRPRLPTAALPVGLAALVALILVGWPLFRFGFDWIANANDDMANYVLSATRLLHHGLLSPLSVSALTHDRNYSTVMWISPEIGSRPGADLLLAGVAGATGMTASSLFMPLILSLNMVTVCAAGALAMQAASRAWAAVLAAVLVMASPLEAYGVVQQLLPQVWGVGLAAALLALLMASGLHEERSPRWPELAAVGVLVASLVLVYVELAATIFFAYLLFFALVLWRRAARPRTIAWTWAVALAGVAVFLNIYVVRELSFVLTQGTHGVSKSMGTLFGYSLVPSALSAVIGVSTFSNSGSTRVSVGIALGLVLLGAVVVAAFSSARRGMAAAVVLVVYTVLGVVLAVQSSDFGLFKLYMYAQPFLAASVAVWVSRIAGRRRLIVALAALAVLVVAELGTQREYVSASTNPIDLPNASSASLLPAFRHILAEATSPVVSVTDHPTLAKLEAANAGDRRIFFISRDVFTPLLRTNVPSASVDAVVADYRRHSQWVTRRFDLHSSPARVDPFSDNTHASAVLARGRCVVVLPTGSEWPFNRRTLPAGTTDLVSRPCAAAHDLLAFTTSALGQSFYLFDSRPDVSYYQLQPDYFYPGATISGVGRYLLFRVLGASTQVRFEVDLTDTVRSGATQLPAAAAVGDARVPLPLQGHGSARVFSPPLRPQMIGGQPYVLLDFGPGGRTTPVPRGGLEALYGQSVPLDTRALTSYIRDVSLVRSSAVSHLRRPLVVASFPAGLANPNLEYSGFYEDGWMAGRAYVVLAGGSAAQLDIRGDNVLPVPGQRLQVVVNGRQVADRATPPGTLDLRIPIPAAHGDRKVELRWAKVSRLTPPDTRPATAHLTKLGIVPRAAG